MNNHALAYIGRNLSLYVYILHIAAGKSVDLIFGKMKIGGSTLAIIGRPFMVVSLSLMAAFIAHSIFIKIKIKRGST